MTAGRFHPVASPDRVLCRRPGPRGSRAFTLVELLLAISLILLLLGAVVFNFSTLQRGVQLEEGASQVEALIQYARAQAASTGRRVQIDYSELAGQLPADTQPVLRLLWERDPFGAPGVFEELPGSAAYVRGILDIVRFESVAPSDPAPSQGPASAATAGTNNALVALAAAPAPGATNSAAMGEDSSGFRPFQPVTFYPDGSCDPMRLVLISQDDEDERRIALDLSGLTPEVLRRFLPRDPTLRRDASQQPAEADSAPDAGDQAGEAPP